MIVIRYALVLRDGTDKKVAVVGTGREPFRKAKKVAPDMEKFIRSCLAMHPTALTVEVVAWKPGVDVELAPVVLSARRVMEDPPYLAFDFSDVTVEVQSGN